MKVISIRGPVNICAHEGGLVKKFAAFQHCPPAPNCCLLLMISRRHGTTFLNPGEQISERGGGALGKCKRCMEGQGGREIEKKYLAS